MSICYISIVNLTIHEDMRILLFLLGSLFSLTGYAQSLNSTCSQPRGGDWLVKRMIAACEPGKSGVGQVWDFSDLEFQEVKYELKYMAQGVDTVIGTEHRTMYYYRTSGDSLFCLGYENPTTFITYQKPELLLTFPVFQGRAVTDYFDGKGRYCEKLDVHLRGKSMITADASGMLILPEGDTLRKVLRVYTHRFIHQRMTPILTTVDTLQLDSLAFILNHDSIEYLLSNDSTHLETETWRWYADGYRYPVFETVKSTTYRFGNAHKYFTTSFVYLPEEQYYDLSYDTDNQKRRDEVSNEKREREWWNTDEGGVNGRRNDVVSYSFGIGDDGNLQINYTLKQSGDVSLIIFDLQGRQLSNISKRSEGLGKCREIISLSGYSKGEYILQIVAGEKVYGEKFFKP